jgi:hypothetical protein
MSLHHQSLGFVVTRDQCEEVNNERMLVFSIHGSYAENQEVPDELVYHEIIEFQGEMYCLHAIIMQPYRNHYSTLLRTNHWQTGRLPSRWLHIDSQRVTRGDLGDRASIRAINSTARLVFYVAIDQALGWIAMPRD